MMKLLPSWLQTPVVVDACALMNLCAVIEVIRDLRKWGVPLYVAPKVIGETLFNYLGGDGPDAKDKVPIDTSAMIRDGLLLLVSLTPKEQELFVTYAGRVDDGEAESCAVAIERGWVLLTDDNSAIKVMRDEGHVDMVLTTPGVLRSWAEIAEPDPRTLRDCTRRIRQCAHYEPSRTHRYRAWWDSLQ